MKISFTAFFLLFSWITSAHAAGFQMVKVDNSSDGPIQVAVWYPSTATPSSNTMGPYRQDVAIGGKVEGTSLPLVVISHGTGGSSLGHYDTALALADAGFVVAALTHPGDNHADQSKAVFILNRPKHISRVIDYMLSEWSGKERIDSARIGMYGFSAGGFTALVTIGGKPDLSLVGPHCSTHRGDFACELLAQNKTNLPQIELTPSAGLKDNRVRAAVIAAPALGFTFGKAGLREVSVPIQLWRAENDTVLPHPWYAEAVRNDLPVAPEYHVVSDAGHFDFLAPCSERLAAIAPNICASSPGFNRSAFHARFNSAVVAFFKEKMR
ncbi:MAG TPA: dienelactone hydrolase [Noviherbaspirillum sp.]|jgi:predicted dienelactone hydrolase|uniref:alpha/beta hydrolase family protein n=1 Tax=Noviherbaspirillum sp. TaxID=1926288 RepID=UPI002DDD14AF|nr:dienelactone hydrolase [Noviherbaspirillum sp.]HEV2608789.1 dienelactone hydrolase [Noviherbaspirillum sp.]